MGDISELRGLTVIVTFLAFIVFSITLTPGDLLQLGYAYEGRTYDIPDYFEAIDIQSYAETKNHTMDGTGCVDMVTYWTYKFKLGNRNLMFDYEQANKTQPSFDARMIHYWYWWIFPTAHHEMRWYNKKGIDCGEVLWKNQLDQDYDEGIVRYTVKCSHFQIDTFFGFNETLYSKPSEAWDHHGLAVMWCIEFDQVNTSVNAWSLVAMLLFFQLPEVHWIINVIVGFVIWPVLGYLIFIFILRAIGAIFGGGGA